MSLKIKTFKTTATYPGEQWERKHNENCCTVWPLFPLQGILYVDKKVVGWRPIARAWLENRSQQEVHVRVILMQYI